MPDHVPTNIWPRTPSIPARIEALGIAPPHQATSSIAPSCEAHLVTDAAQLDELEAEWRALFDKAPTASPPLRWEWVREWWRIYGPVYGDRGRGLRLITVRRGSDLVGILPLYHRSMSRSWASRQLRFVSTGEEEFEETCAEYLDLIHMPGAAGECVAAVGRTFTDDPRLTWDQLVLSGIHVESPLLGLREPLEASGTRTDLKTTGICCISDLSGGFEAYLGRISQKSRATARKLLRDVERSGMVFELAATAEEADQYFDEMVMLHRERWESVGKSGCFAPRHADFHRALCRALVPSGGATLARLSFEGKAFAVTYGHLTRDTYYCYQRGVRMVTSPVHSPGTAAIMLLMAHLVGRGAVHYNHLAGPNSFKKKFSTGQEPLVDLRILKPNLRNLVTTTADLARRATAKVARVTKGSIRGGRPTVGTSPASAVGDQE